MLTANQNHSDKLCLIIRTKPDDNDMKLCFEDHCIIGDCDGYVRWVGHVSRYQSGILTPIYKRHIRVGCDSHTRWLGRILTDAILLNGVGDCDGYVRRKVGGHISKYGRYLTVGSYISKVLYRQKGI